MELGDACMVFGGARDDRDDTPQKQANQDQRRPTRPAEKWTASLPRWQAASGRASEWAERADGRAVERCSVTESLIESSKKFTVQEVGEPKTHMGRHWPPAPDTPGLCDDTSSISRKVVYFVSPSFSFPCPAEAMLLLVESMHTRTALQLCTITLHHHARWLLPLLLLLLLCCCYDAAVMLCCWRGRGAKDEGSEDEMR